MNVAYNLLSAKAAWKAGGQVPVPASLHPTKQEPWSRSRTQVSKCALSSPIFSQREVRLHLETLPSWPTKAYRILTCNLIWVRLDNVDELVYGRK